MTAESSAPAAGKTGPQETGLQEGRAEIVLVGMPWSTTSRPSIALGILDRLCAEQEVSCASIFPNLDLAARIGLEAHRPMADERALFGLGEHVFAVDLFGAEALDSDSFLELICRLPLPPPYNDRAFVADLRDRVVPAFLDETVARILSFRPAVVGFTATFNQVMASIATAARLKRARPDLVVLAGGACFDGEMGQEYHRALPHVLDHVFMGEAEDSFRTFLARRRAGGDGRGIPGVTWIEGGELRLVPGVPLAEMDRSPMPNYQPYFAEVERVQAATGLQIVTEALPVEGSRGCWWGQKNHCLFCGINPALLKFREKSPERVVDEMVLLSHIHGVPKLTATDWIVSRRSRLAIFAALRDLDLDLEVFYETRSDLDKAEVKLMKEAGALRVQPGIESFSTPVLKLMRKGTTGIRQVRFLKWAREYGVKLSYNILCGFPGDRPEWYLEMAELIRAIPHLQPPTNNATFIELHRFSPLFEQREAFGIQDYDLRVDYRFNFPRGMVDPRKIGYFFEYEAGSICDPSQYMPQVQAAIEPWLASWEARRLPRFDYALGPGFVEIHDGRDGEGRTMVLRGLAHDLFLLLDDIGTLHGLAADLAPKYPRQVDEGLLEHVVEELVRQRILLREGNALLALPVAVKPRDTAELRRYVLGADGAEGGMADAALTAAE